MTTKGGGRCSRSTPPQGVGGSWCWLWRVRERRAIWFLSFCQFPEDWGKVSKESHPHIHGIETPCFFPPRFTSFPPILPSALLYPHPSGEVPEGIEHLHLLDFCLTLLVFLLFCSISAAMTPLIFIMFLSFIKCCIIYTQNLVPISSLSTFSYLSFPLFSPLHLDTLNGWETQILWIPSV